jgi:hypothetical protein
LKEISANTNESDTMSKDLKNWGFKFLGSAICDVFMQAIGMVNHHTIKCFRYKNLHGCASSDPLLINAFLISFSVNALTVLSFGLHGKKYYTKTV